MKPRSVVKTIEWFPHFADLAGRNWDETVDGVKSRYKDKSIYPARREYIYNAHRDELDFVNNFHDYLSGMYDHNETESAGRNDKTSFEFFGFGYVEPNGTIRSTRIGDLIHNNKMSDELLLRQLLKIRFPSPAVGKKTDGEYVFPMEVILKAFQEFDTLNKFELGLLFGCSSIDKIDTTLNAIRTFKKEYVKLESRLDLAKVKELFEKIFKKAYPKVTNKLETYYKDYSDALSRALMYSGLFASRGRGLYAKVYIPEHSKLKVELLQKKYNFEYYDNESFIEYMNWFGDPYNITLPWENVENRKYLITKKVEILQKNIEEAKAKIDNFIAPEINVFELTEEKDKGELIELDIALSNQITSLNEELFIKYTSKTEEARTEIIEKFNDILQGNEDMGALWLEVNTWKSIVAMNGEHKLKRNFKIEEDLTPKSFAPGSGNTPDMELYKNGYIILPEVSLMTGVRQWEHEGSSVIDHVFKFIEKYQSKEVYGLFISSRMNIRTIWQFFILNRESWIGKAVPVIPLTIEQYVNVLEFIYSNNLCIDDFKLLIELIHKNTFDCKSFGEWQNGIDNIIKGWKRLFPVAS